MDTTVNDLHSSPAKHASFWKFWSFSLFLIPLYLISFHLWLVLGPRGIMMVGIIATVVGIIAFLEASKQKYFLNRWDAFFHSTVIFDIFMEGVFIPLHIGYSFYLCAISFVIIVGGYRWWLSKKKSREAV
ncbi:hypothetical protein [Rubellicoccus peritrichatus]|uniref:Uncharacterized protein n=1 Tax=Rubellicoccus peritrichatus TaxID=3080537 RepID=A0AAQ3QVJ5_9BACT|nr:hypothetical protein [Puniceicoccus sp. CR14]WOO40965.1 hypothetical protein RZN69_20280 [Puniceicoccus sp. CR14]